MEVFGIKIVNKLVASDEVDVVLNQNNTHSESNKAKRAKTKREKKKWSNSEIHKFFETTFSKDYGIRNVSSKCIIPRYY